MPTEAEINALPILRGAERARSGVERHLSLKPFCDPARSTYLLDDRPDPRVLAAIAGAPAGSGLRQRWTSEIFARSGYDVLGLDIAPDMIQLARRRMTEALALSFEVADYEGSFAFGEFDAVVIYDALHHAENEAGVIANAFRGLRHGGVFISIEPGVGPHDGEHARRGGEVRDDGKGHAMRASGRTAARGWVFERSPVPASEPADARERHVGGRKVATTGPPSSAL
jgi:SAM-dependent methyltransferase